MSFGENKQPYYERGRQIREVRREDIEAICRCGYLTLSPTNEMESANGGLMVKRKSVRILRADGSLVRVLRGVHRYYACNACVNKWK